MKRNTTHDDAPLPMTEDEWAERLKRSRQALSSWTHEATLSWADREMTRAICETEIGVLQYYIPFMPVKPRPEVPPLVHDWD